MKLTPDQYSSIKDRWEEYAGNSAQQVYSASEQQRSLASTKDGVFYKYVSCLLCGHDKYSMLYRQTAYSVTRWKDVLTHTLVRLVGKKWATFLLKKLLRKYINLNGTYAVGRCVNCGFLFRNPTYTLEGLERAYNSGGYVSFLTGEYSRKRAQLYGYFYDLLKVDSRTQGFERKRVLDIGCGFGLLLDFLQSKGWDPYGVDFASDAITYGQKELGLKNISVGNLEHDSFEENYFDMVTLASVIEHLDDPVDMLARIHRVLRPGGVLLITTPNAGSFNHKQAYQRWGGFWPNHLVFFDRGFIREALSKAGFSSIVVANDRRELDSMVRSGKIPAEHASYFEVVFEKENLGSDLAVLATRD